MRKQYYILCLCMCFTSFVSAQKGDWIKGTNVYITIPSEFEITNNPTLIKKGEEASIDIIELMGVNYFEKMKNFKANLDKDKTVEVVAFRETKINGFDAQEARYYSGNELNGITTVFGNKNFSVILVGQYKGISVDLLSSIERAFQSVEYKIEK